MSSDVGAVVLITAVVSEIAKFGGGQGCGIRLRAEGVQIRCEETLEGIEAVLALVPFAAADLIMPMRTGSQVPASVGAEIMKGIALMEAGRLENGLAGDAGFAGVVAEGKAKLIGLAEAVTKISGKGAVEKIVVRSLAGGFEIRGRTGIV